MSLDFSLLTRHPYITGTTIFIGGIGLYLYWRSGSASSSSAVSTISSNPGVPVALQQTAIQAATAIQIAQAQANAQSAQLNAASSSDALKAQTAITLAKINAEASTQQQVNAINGSTNIAGIQAGVQSQQIAATEAVQSQSISTQGQIANETIQAQLVQQKLIDDLSGQIAGYATQVQLAEINSHDSVQQAVVTLLKNGALGNSNRAAVATALLGQGGASQAIANASVYNSPAAIIGSVGNAIGSTLSKIFVP